MSIDMKKTLEQIRIHTQETGKRNETQDAP